MSKNVAVFVDVANLYYSARGQDVDVDYVALLKYATKGRDLIRAYAYSGLDPENENQRKFLDFLGKNGYKVVAKDIRKFGDGRVKANLDIELVVDLFRLAGRMDVAVIVSGDGDFAPAIRALQDEGVRCEVISFRPNTSGDLMAVADEFVDVMKIVAIGRGTEAKGMGAPEMPAKEVNPEFGFRDASPAMAAAALAAIREPESAAAGGRSRSTGRRRVAARGGTGSNGARTTAPAAAAPAADSEAGTAEGRRRRRRGGRGRGRGRSRTTSEQTPVGEAAPAATEWQELDGVLDVDPGREYTFEEADADTLAELGLSSQPSAQPAAEETPAPAARRRPATRSTRRAPKASTPEGGVAEVATVDAEATGGTAPAPAPAIKRPSRRAAGAATTSTTRSTAKAPTRRPRSVGTAKAAPADDEAGIWERFASGRRTRSRKAGPPESGSTDQEA